MILIGKRDKIQNQIVLLYLNLILHNEKSTCAFQKMLTNSQYIQYKQKVANVL